MSVSKLIDKQRVRDNTPKTVKRVVYYDFSKGKYFIKSKSGKRHYVRLGNNGIYYYNGLFRTMK